MSKQGGRESIWRERPGRKKRKGSGRGKEEHGKTEKEGYFVGYGRNRK